MRIWQNVEVKAVKVAVKVEKADAKVNKEDWNAGIKRYYRTYDK